MEYMLFSLNILQLFWINLHISGNLNIKEKNYFFKNVTFINLIIFSKWIKKIS